MSTPEQEDDFQTDHLEAMAEETVDISEGLDGDLEALRQENEDLKDRLLRALADAENTRKRSERDRVEAANYGGSRLAKDVLPVYDNLVRAIDLADDAQREAAKGVFEGVELTLRELTNVLSQHGIEPIKPEIGQKFDPQQHQAMFEAPVPDTKAGDIIQVMTEGFMIRDRLLRPAQVGVSSTPG